MGEDLADGMDIGAFLAHHVLFSHLDPRGLADVAGRALERRLARGEVLALEGEPCEAVYLVVEGRVRALKMSPQGREQVVNELRAGQILYVVPALDGGPLPTTSQAATRATLLAWRVGDWLELLDRYPSLERRLLVDFAGRLRRLADLVGELALYSVPERLARLLLELSEEPPQRRLTQQEMATRLGTVREVVARTLAGFQARGWLMVDRGRIEIHDVEALRDLASR